ncbi:MAG: hypothetical protein C4560_10445 [Nitrospiraceae bacterium]|nr:MAG: hypothetical protein C4560_10445 [Nitrospiraceae bacterium]
MRNLKTVVVLVMMLTFCLPFAAVAEQADEKETHKTESPKEVLLVHAEEPPISGSVGLGVFNRYVFRGYELSTDSFVVQPYVSVSYKYFSASFWGNIDSEENPTQSFAPDRADEKSFNETDLTLSYTFVIDKLSLTGGYIYYGTKYTAETEELFLTMSYDTLLKPALSVYRDITEYPGTYVNLSVAHSIPLVKDITLDLGASAGYFAGDYDYWNTYESSTGDYTGDKYSAFHDGMVKAGLTIPVAENISVQPVVQYWFPLSGKAKRTVDGASFNHNGKLDDTLVAGINMTLGF